MKGGVQRADIRAYLKLESFKRNGKFTTECGWGPVMLYKKVDPANDHFGQKLAQAYSSKGGRQVTPFCLYVLVNTKI